MKRAKIIALVLSLMTLVSVAPQGVSAKTRSKELKERDGVIEQAYLGENGRYVIQGYPDDKDYGLWYVHGNSEKQLDEDEDLGEVIEFRDRDKLITDEDYEIDVSNGHVTDDYDDEDIKEEFYKQCKHSDVYEFEDASDVKFDKLEKIPNSKFYFYQIGDKSGVVDKDGNYIDVTRYANLKVSPKDSEKTVKIKEYGQSYDSDEEDDTKLTLKSIKPIAADSRYLYFLCTNTLESGSNSDEVYTIMKITNKGQKDEDDDTYYVNSVISYLVDTDESDIADADAFTARHGKLYSIKKDEDNGKIAITNLKTDRVKKDGRYSTYMVEDEVEKVEADMYTTDVYGNIWLMGNGRIYGYDGEEAVQYYRADSGCDHLEVYDSKHLMAWEDGEEEYYTIFDNSKDDDDDEGEDEDKDTEDDNAEDKDSADQTGETTDTKTVNGTGLYKVGFNVVGQNSWDKTYSIDGKTLVKSQWIADNGKWYYFNEAGQLAVGWMRDPKTFKIYHMDEMSGEMSIGWYLDPKYNLWYYFDGSGAMHCGWLLQGSTWYYMQNTGIMMTGWLQSYGKWYYMNLGSGAMLTSTTTPDGYWVGADGVWK